MRTVWILAAIVFGLAISIGGANAAGGFALPITLAASSPTDEYQMPAMADQTASQASVAEARVLHDAGAGLHGPGAQASRDTLDSKPNLTSAGDGRSKGSEVTLASLLSKTEVPKTL